MGGRAIGPALAPMTWIWQHAEWPARSTVELHAGAVAALSRLAVAGMTVPSTDWFLYGFVRKEAVITSQIEGTQATLPDVVTFEATDRAERFEDVQEVCNYVDALTYARVQLTDPNGLPLSIRLLRDTRRILMSGVRGADKQPGEVRRSQNWIGGKAISSRPMRPLPSRNGWTCCWSVRSRRWRWAHRSRFQSQNDSARHPGASGSVPQAPRRPTPPLSRGSSRSRTASPNMFRQYTTIVRHSPGHSASRGATSMNSRPSRLSIPPQLGTEIGRPNPRKLSAASLIITAPTLMVKMMMIGAAMLGSALPHPKSTRTEADASSKNPLGAIPP